MVSYTGTGFIIFLCGLVIGFSLDDFMDFGGFFYD